MFAKLQPFAVLDWGKANMLYQRITKQGTLSEPKGVPDPQFALPATINWMRALSLLANGIDCSAGASFYAHVNRRHFTPQEENTVLEQLLFALHQVSALSSLKSIARKSDVSRVGIVAWYYGIYAAASAMGTAQSGSFQDDHSGTAREWDVQLVQRGLVMSPFDSRISSLLPQTVKNEVSLLRKGSVSDLKVAPMNLNEANGAHCAYLSGTADFMKWRVEEDLRAHKEFKALGVSDFRTKAAKALRDDRLKKRAVCFLNQAFRYRGKANYREALYLGHGASVETLMQSYVGDLDSVLRAFVTMAGAFSARRLGAPLWQDFIQDLDKHRSFTVGPREVWA